jgi:hypothetical protein
MSRFVNYFEFDVAFYFTSDLEFCIIGSCLLSAFGHEKETHGVKSSPSDLGLIGLHSVLRYAQNWKVLPELLE